MVDLDGVFVNFYPSWIAKLNEKTGQNRNVEDLRELYADRLYGITREQLIEYFYELDVLALPEVPGASFYLRKLHEEGHENHIVTARVYYDYLKDLTKEYLRRLNAPYDSITFEVEKLEVIMKLGLDTVIEDDPEMALKCDSKGIPIILFDAPYNRDVEGERIFRVNNWEQAYWTIRNMDYLLRQKERKCLVFD